MWAGSHPIEVPNRFPNLNVLEKKTPKYKKGILRFTLYSLIYTDNGYKYFLGTIIKHYA